MQLKKFNLEELTYMTRKLCVGEWASNPKPFSLQTRLNSATACPYRPASTPQWHQRMWTICAGSQTVPLNDLFVPQNLPPYKLVAGLRLPIVWRYSAIMIFTASVTIPLGINVAITGSLFKRKWIFIASDKMYKRQAMVPECYFDC